ncbi:MAG: sulfatase, partial [Pseudomonadota bacterium]
APTTSALANTTTGGLPPVIKLVRRLGVYSHRCQKICVLAIAALMGALLALKPATAQDVAPTITPIVESEPNSAKRKPNIVFIFADDLGYGDVSAFGARDIKTPNIDAIAERGARFSQFYSVSPVCTPSRAGLLTGRYPIRMGIHHVFFPGSYTGMPEDEITIAELLQGAGYATAVIGKWHLGHHQQFLPLNQGFDEFFGIPYSNDMLPLPYMRGNEYIEHNVDQSLMTQRLTDEAVDFIERHSDVPFFLYIPHPMPHAPIFHSKAFEGVSQRGAYGDVIEELDASVGRIVNALETKGILNDTLLVFTSDNGPWIFMGDEGGSPGALRNGKGTTFEGGVRVPTVAMFPNVIAAGSEFAAPAFMLDWFPTIAELAGVETPLDRVIDGETIAYALRGETPLHERTLFFYSHGQIEAIRMGDWKLKRAFDSSRIPAPGVLRIFLDGEMGLESHGPLLFNLADDPSEKRDLTKKEPQRVTELEQAIAKFESELGETPASITDTPLELSPAVGVLIGAVIKVALIIIAIMLTGVALLAYFFGTRWRKAITKEHAAP